MWTDSEKDVRIAELLWLIILHIWAAVGHCNGAVGGEEDIYIESWLHDQVCGVRLGGGVQHVCSAVVVVLYCLVNHSIVVLRKFYSVAQQKTGQGCSE